MQNAYGILAIIGLALTPWAPAAQAQANQPTAPAAQPGSPSAGLGRRGGQAAEAAPALISPDQQPTKEQMAKLFEVMHVREQLQAFQKMMPAVIQRQLHAQMEQTLAKLAPAVQPTPEQEAQLEAILNKYMQKAFNIYPYDDMIADMTTVYQRHISRSDVEAIIAFYSSPAGQDLLTQQPVIMKEFLPIAIQHEQTGAAELTVEMTQELNAFMKSIAPPAEAPAQNQK